jgi:hypothetical protein
MTDYKDVNLDIDVDINKDIDVDVDVDLKLDGNVAEANATADAIGGYGFDTYADTFTSALATTYSASAESFSFAAVDKSHH